MTLIDTPVSLDADAFDSCAPVDPGDQPEPVKLSEPVELTTLAEPFRPSSLAEPFQPDALAESLRRDALAEPFRPDTLAQPLRPDTLAQPLRPDALAESFAAALAALDRISTDIALYRSLPEQTLLEINRIGAASRQLADSHMAIIAGAVAYRSRPELGLSGLAQRAGLRTPQEFVKITTGATGRDAATAVRVGVMMHDSAIAGTADEITGVVAEDPRPWLRAVTAALAERALSVEQAQAISFGLAEPTSAIPAEALAGAAVELVRACVEQHIDPDALAKLARQIREELDLEGVALREEERWQKRSLRLYPQTDGTTKLIWILDPESAASVRDIVDRATSPKLGGVRFVDPERATKAQAILDDERTAEQLASDAMLQLIKIGAGSDPAFLLGSGAPVIRVTATATALETGVGLGRIDGQEAPISIASVKRLTCSGIARDVIFDTALRPLDLGRDQRLFTPKQREALNVKWGGCAMPGCDRPPSWTEDHHIDHWLRDHGKTNVDDGLPLCSHHHRHVHKHEWEFEHDPLGNYWLIKSVEDDPNQTPILLTPKSRNMMDLQREHRCEQERGPRREQERDTGREQDQDPRQANPATRSR